ncbi:MAG TPA: CDGSH iron-sulfur domain-containing protein [Streptomyces sp.]
MPNASEQPTPRRVTVDRDGPVLIEGPVEVVTDDGTVCRSERFVVAVCTCRRSRTYPWCDTSHRAHSRPPAAGRPRQGGHQEPDPEDSHDGDRH